MNNNFLHRFTATPFSMNGPRSGFNLSSTHKTTLRPGLLIPIGKQLVMPGDIVKGKVNACVRALQQFLDVPMDDLYVDTYAVYCPFRILNKNWKAFEGENQSTAGVLTTEVVLPYFVPNVTVIADAGDELYWTNHPDTTLGGDFVLGKSTGSLDSYLGYPVITYDSQAAAATYAPACNGLDIITYYKCWNFLFRDQNTQAPLSGLDTFYNLASGASYSPEALFNSEIASIRGISETFDSGALPGCCLLAPVNKYHDYFTSCLPSPNGKTVYLPLGDYANVIAHPDGDTHSTGNVIMGNSSYLTQTGPLYGGAGSYMKYSSGAIPSGAATINSTNLVADLSQVTGIPINTIRLSISTQLYYENLQLGGSRYKETRKSIWDEPIRDDLIDEPEFLAGDHTILNIQAVNNTSSANSVAIGKQSANSVSLIRGSNAYVKRCHEFGYIMTFMCIRYKHTYNQGINRDMMVHRQFDLFNPFFDSIGNTPVYKDELFVNKNVTSAAPVFLGDGQVFGYQEAWADYRDGSVRNRVSGVFHPDAGLTDFASWTFTDSYDSIPSLSGSWMCEDPSNITRCMVGVQYGPYPFGADIDNVCIAYRRMKTYSRPSRLGM